MYFLGEASNFLTLVDESIRNFYFNAVDSIKTNEDFLEYEGREFLMRPLVNLNHRNESGLHPIHYAIISRNNLAFEWLMRNPQINVTQISEIEAWNPAHCAVINANPFALERLVQAGVQLNQKDSNKMTPLAYLDDNFNAESLLLSILNMDQFDLNARSGEYGRSYAHFWARDTTLKLLDSLLERAPELLNGADSSGITPLMIAAETDQVATVKRLISRSAEYEALDSQGRSALHMAAASGNADVTKLLLFDSEAIKDTHMHSLEDFESVMTIDQTHSRELLFKFNIHGMTPLMDAVNNAQINVVSVLLDHLEPDSFIDLQSTITGDTALHLAAKTNSPKMVKLLLERGAFADAINFEGKKPIECTDNQEIIETIQFDISK